MVERDHSDKVFITAWLWYQGTVRLGGISEAATSASTSSLRPQLHCQHDSNAQQGHCYDLASSSPSQPSLALLDSPWWHASVALLPPVVSPQYRTRPASPCLDSASQVLSATPDLRAGCHVDRFDRMQRGGNLSCGQYPFDIVQMMCHVNTHLAASCSLQA